MILKMAEKSLWLKNHQWLTGLISLKKTLVIFDKADMSCKACKNNFKAPNLFLDSLKSAAWEWRHTRVHNTIIPVIFL